MSDREGEHPKYLAPYLSAAQRHAGGFRSLLWASVSTQEKRFEAFTRVCDFRGKSILDVGCGRADLLEYLHKRAIEPDHYVGLEAVPLLADAAGAKRLTNSLIVRGDFVTEPRRMYVGADVVVFSGSLNTLEDDAFFATLRYAHEASTGELVFNFLNSRLLAGTKYLHWHKKSEVKRFVESMGGVARVLDDYIGGDCTIYAKKLESGSTP